MFDPFDFNHDGKVDMFEMGLGMEILEDGFQEEQKQKRSQELSDLGLDVSDLADMDPIDREDTLLDAGLDPTDFNSDFDF